MMIERKSASLERKVYPFVLTKAADDGGEFEGYAAAFNNVDSYGDIIAPGAFVDSLPKFLQDGFVGGLNHNWYDPIGKPMAASEDEQGLYVKGTIEETNHGKDCRVLIKQGVVKKMSIGFIVKGREWLDTPAEVEKHWAAVGYQPSEEDRARCKYGARLLTKINLFEFSPVTLPANSMADITGAKGAGPEGVPTLSDHSLKVIEDIEEWIGRLGELAQKRSGDEDTLPKQHAARLKVAHERIADLLAAKPEQASAALKARAEAARLDAQHLAILAGGKQ